mgnify:FL=1
MSYAKLSTKEKMKTFLRRWWLLNRLFHFSKHHFGMVAPLDQFLEWMVGLDIYNRKTSWYTGSTKVGKLHQWVTWKLYNSTAAKKVKILPDTQVRELRQLINEMKAKKLIENDGSNVALSPIGLEQYAVSYIFFGSYYGKKTITRIIEWGIPILFIWLATYFFNITIGPKQTSDLNEQQQTTVLSQP